ncbi:MAG: CDP-alcohol phosphatidyltransferase family protein [Gemmatimonadota bacterium]|nr:CDP-alcohol phosphatidyltransferase family protein [Gemmatimonadota bacterium]
MRLLLWAITLLRLVLIPVFVKVGLSAQAAAAAGEGGANQRWMALGILFAMGLSDVLDGFIARRYGLATQLGAILDAAIDKVVQASLIGFFAVSVGPVFTPVPVWFLAFVVGRELVGLGGWLVLRAMHGPIAIVHRFHGRLETVGVFSVLAWAALGLPEGGLSRLLDATVVIGVLSSLAYWFEGRARGRARVRLEGGPAEGDTGA